MIDCVRGNMAINLALVAPLLICSAGLGIDFQGRLAQQAALQDAADNLALRAARELLLDNATSQNIESLIRAWADVQYARPLGAFDLTPKVDTQARTVSVDIAQGRKKGFFLSNLVAAGATVNASAVAQAQGVTNVCVIALEDTEDYAIRAGMSAKLSASKCAILSNSTSNRGISVGGMAKLTAKMICTAGGSDGGALNYSPMPIPDCPVYSDPLGERTPPSVGGCDYIDAEFGTQVTSLAGAKSALDSARLAGTDVSSGSSIPGYTIHEIEPGVYCGGLKINSSADVRMAPGVYIMKDGPLEVDLGASLRGENVGFYLTGANATFRFGLESMIYLTAPKAGLMAGLLFFEDRAAPEDRSHAILSANARTLLGTIYLPRGRLTIASLQPVADESAYTAIVARKIQMSGSPTLVLNANYAATDIPVPDGVGPTGGQIYLRD